MNPLDTMLIIAIITILIVIGATFYYYKLRKPKPIVKPDVPDDSLEIFKVCYRSKR